MREELERQARSDALTGLPNRRDLLERLDAVLAHEPRAGTSTAVLFLDLDQLKELNDTHGHRIGDAVLVEVGRRITAVAARRRRRRPHRRRRVRRAPAVPRRARRRVARGRRHPRAAREAAIVVGDVRVRASVSIGLTIARPGDRPEDVLHRADVALYRAKDAGRGRTEADVSEGGIDEFGAVHGGRSSDVAPDVGLPVPRRPSGRTAPTVPHDL